VSLFERENIYMKLSPKNVAQSFHLNSLNAELNPICHLLTLLRAHHILHVSGIRVNQYLLLPSLLFTKPYKPAFVTNEHFCPAEVPLLVTTKYF
jgi:hypothetical protein